jgi:addiction module RelE/StbE family toxin
MTVRWTPTALRDLDALHSFISEDNATAALAVVEALLKGIAALTRNPEMGRTGRVAGSRELVVAPYVIAYRSRKSVIEILGIIHGSRRWPDSF